MAIDIRAEVSCSLGTVISGSFADDYLQGNGLIKTRGEVVLAGTQTPVVGTQVTFTYDKGGTTYTVPRVLRVLSSFADPFRRTTTVQLGCKLTYLENRKPPVQNPNGKDEHSSVPCKVFLQATLPISAAYVFQQCLTALGVSSDSIPLTNKFSVDEFDLAPGYVQVMSDLLQSEGYVGYLNSSETLKFIDLSVAAASGPLITPADVADLGPIGSGDLPGESIIVRWSNQRLLPPDQLYGDNYLKRSWEIEEVFGAPADVSVSYTNDAGNTVSANDVFYPYSFTATRYDKWDRKIESISLNLVSSAEVNNRWASDAFRTGRLWNRATARVVREVIEYKKAAAPANAVNLMAVQGPGGGPSVVKSALAAAAASHNALASLCKEEVPEGADVVKSQTTYNYFSELELAGSLNIDSYISTPAAGGAGTLVNFSTTAEELDSSVVVQYETDAATGISKTLTKRYVSRSQTVSGQQDLATRAQSLDTVNLSTSINGLLNAARRQVYVGAETMLHTQKEFGVQKRPAESERNNTANSKPQVSESKAEITWITGSTTSTAVTEFTLPYAPDDAISWNAATGQFTSTPSDAEQKAMRYGRIQNALLLGNRNGVSLQLAPEKLPKRPFDPLYLQAAGITGSYRVNGTSWAFDANGIVASTDALLWGAVSASSGSNLASSWIPLAPNTSSLPLPYTVTPGQVDPETGSSFAAVITPTTVLPPYRELVAVAGITRSSVTITDYPYALNRGTATQAAATRTRLIVGSKLTAAAESYALAGQTADLQYGRALVGSAGSLTYNGFGAGSVRSYGIGTNAGAFSFAGQPAMLKRTYTSLNAEAGSVVLSGQASEARLGVNLLAEAGSVAVGGQSASKLQLSVLAGGVASLTASGQSAGLTYVTPNVKILTYTGNGTSTNAITGVGFKPGLVWSKRISGSAEHHALYHAISNPIAPSDSYYGLLTSYGGANSSGTPWLTFDSAGFTLKQSSFSNTNSVQYWAMCLKEGGTAASNTDGALATTVSVNSALKFSQFKYDPNGSVTTIGHGLGVTPELVFAFVAGYSSGVYVGGSVIGDNNYLVHDSTAAAASNTNSFKSFSSTTIGIGSFFGINRAEAAWAYGWAFASSPGISKIGTFTGNGSATQAITGLGFPPSFVMVKSYSGGTSDWVMFSSGRDGRFFANTTAVEQSNDYITFDSNGFTLESGASVNSAGVSYLYLAFR